MNWEENNDCIPASRELDTCVAGCTVGPTDATGDGRGSCTFVRGDEVGGGRVGYFRAVFAGDSFDAVFAVFNVDEAPLEAEDPIVK